MADEKPPIIKKVKKVEGHGHHGGAWKIAYADFVTAMMAFFLLLWLLSATDEEQRKGIADYFTPTFASTNSSGGDGVLGGSSLGADGSTASGSVVVSLPAPSSDPSSEEADAEDSPKSVSDADVDRAIAEREEQAFLEAEQELMEAIKGVPDLSELTDNLIIDRTPEGLRIQLIDQERRSLFATGSADPLAHTRRLLEVVAKVVLKLPNRLSIAGHTDAAPFSGRPNYSNWELSADRANASRRVLMGARVPAERVSEVLGMAATEPLFPEDPYLTSNRRISITLLREAPVLPPSQR